MKNLFKRVTSFVTALAMTMTLTGGVQLVSFAEEEAVAHSDTVSISIAGTGEADNDLALEHYLNQKIMGDSGISLFNYRSNAADILYQAELDMYNYLVEELTAIADGVEGATSAVFNYSFYWSYEDLGLAANCTEAEFKAALDEAAASVNFYGIYHCLLSDLPYELYWHDKTQDGSFKIGASGSGDGTEMKVTFTMSFLVAEGYGSGTTITNLPDLNAVTSNINNIIAKYAGKSDLEILTGYKDEICTLTDYNDAAADDENNVAYGDPWQLIYVFDGDSSTTVVCEGYSKAFKQLCDMTDFTKDIYCFLVSGDAGGPHMWNIVQIGEEFYHVDVTNSDSGATGYGGGLFLDGVNYTNDENTAFNTAVNLSYTFDDESLYMYPTECTNLSGEKYDEVTVTSIDVSKAKTEYTHGESFDMNELELSVTYSDGSTLPESPNPGTSDDFSVEPETLTMGTTSVTITYKDFEVTCDVTVNPVEGELEYFGDTEMGYGGHATLGCIVEVDGIEINGGTSEFRLIDTNGNAVWEGTGKAAWGGVTTTTGMHYYQLAEDFPPVDKLALGSYEVQFKYSGYDYCAAMTEFKKVADFTIVQGTPNVEPVTVSSPDVITTNTSISNITLSYSGDVEGTVSLDAGQNLTEGTAEYNWTFVPNDTTNYKSVTGTVEITVNAPTELTVTYLSATEYTYGDEDYLIVSLTDPTTNEQTYDGTSTFALYDSEGNTVWSSEGRFSYGAINGTEYKGQSAADMVYFVNYENYSSIEAGSYDLYFEYNGSDNYAAKNYGKIATITVKKAESYDVYVNVKSPVTVYTSTDVDDVVLSVHSMVQGFYHSGTAKFADTVTEFTTDKTDYEVIFTPDNTTSLAVVETTVHIEVVEDIVESISVSENSAAKTAYMAGDSFDPTGLVITVKYESGATRNIAYSDNNKSDFTFDKTTLAYGDTAVTVTYGGQTATVDIVVDKIELELSFPNGTELTYGYPAEIFAALYDGEQYVSDGNSVIAIYEDADAIFGYQLGAGLGATKNIEGTTYKGHIVTSNGPLNSTINEFKVGTIRASFDFEGTDIYAEKSYPFTITVNKLSDYEEYLTVDVDDTIYTSTSVSAANAMLSGSVTINGENYTGTVEFADSVTEFITAKTAYEVIFTPDDENIEVLETTVNINVVEDALESIAVTTPPTKLTYAEGDSFDPTGLVVTATYASNATKDIEHELLEISPATLAKGNTSVTVSYGGKTAEITGLTVKGKLKASDFAFTQPESCVYDKTAKTATVEPFDTVTGIGAITVNYYNGSTKLDGAPTNAGTYTVTIDVTEGTEYAAAEGLTADGWTFTIDKADPVIAPSLRFPSTVYDTTPVEDLDIVSGNSDGGKIEFGEDITLEVGTKDYPVIFTPADTNNYNTVKGTIEITVVKDVITKIEVTTQPTTTEYTYGDEFKADGLVITATYTSGKTEAVKYADTPSEFSFTPDELTANTTEVTVTYAEKNAAIAVKVNKATPSYTAPKNLKANYGDALDNVVLPSGWSWDAPETSVGGAGIRTFPATYSVADDNYEDVKTNLGVVVSPKTISIDSVTVNDKDYDGTTDAVVNEVTFDGVVNADIVDYTATGTFADKNAGEDKSVTVKVTITSENYTLDSDTFTTTATINKADPAVTIPQTASAFTGLPLSKATLPEGWVWDNPTTVPEDGQIYGISYIPEDTANYNTLTAQVTVTVSDCTHPETKVDIKEATCTEDGLRTTICTTCEEPTGTEVIPAEHKWNSTYTVDTEPTCTTEGEKSIHCKNCPEIKPDSAVAIPAGHKWNERYTADSTNHWIDCANCDETKDEGAHSPGYVVNFKQYCSVCGNSYGTTDDEPVKGPGAGTLYPVHTAPKPTEPQIKGENGKSGWDVISDALAFVEDGDTVVVDMNGTTKLPKSVLENIEGRNIDLVLDMGSGITWTINGETVTDPKAVDLRVSKNVKRIPVNVIDNVTGDNFNMEISLAHNGEFGFEAMLTISLGRKYNDCYANLYYYNPSDKAMEFIDSDLIANGNAQLIFGHASDYVIVIDEEALGDDVSSAAGVTVENKTMDTETVSVVFALPLVLAAGFVIRKKLCK